MPNLLADTLDSLARVQKGTQDVTHVVIFPGYEVSWDAFATVATACEYDEDLGDQIMPALKVVGDTWWLEREHTPCFTYSFWTFKEHPQSKTYNHVRPVKLADLVVYGG